MISLEPRFAPPGGRPIRATAQAPQPWPAGSEARTCILIGNEALSVECGEVMRLRGWNIVGVVCDNPIVLSWARKNTLPIFATPALLVDAFAGKQIDCLFSIANLIVLPAAVLTLARRAINFHDGPLPAYSGLNTPTWALLAGETMHGVTWHLMTAGVDRGDIITARSVTIEPSDTSATLNRKCFAAGVESFETVLNAVTGGQELATPQPARERHYFGRGARAPAAGLIRWEQGADEIARHVRALDFGAQFNPLATARVSLGSKTFIVVSAKPQPVSSTAPPGTIVRIATDCIVVATTTHDLALERLADPSGASLSVPAVVTRFHLCAGQRFDVVEDAVVADLSALDATIARYDDFWRARLATCFDFDLPMIEVGPPRSRAAPAALDCSLPVYRAAGSGLFMVAAALGYFARLTDRTDIVLGYADPVLRAQVQSGHGHCARQLPLVVPIAFEQSIETLCAAVAADIRELHDHVGYFVDLVARSPELRGANDACARGVSQVAVEQVEALEDAVLLDGAVLTLVCDTSGTDCRWLYDSALLSEASVAAMHAQFVTLLDAARADPQCPLARLPLLTPDERQRVLIDANATCVPQQGDPCLHELFADQADRTPDAVALICREEALTYEALDRRSNRLARYLVGCGVGPGVLVGVFVERSIALVVALLAIQKAGGAYVPLDPSYPADRVAYMIEDAHMSVVLCTGHVRDHLPVCSAKVVNLDMVAKQVAAMSAAPVVGRARSDDLAYVIYTSGSTGKPKGVMVEHRNVVNFYVGMDAHIAAPGTLLALTSLSFDISVLELCWTLTRGFTVVIHAGDAAQAAAAPALSPPAFSLFYFSSDAGESGEDKYRLLLEGAKFADSHGFSAVWTPERHFHAFGGLYPNPAVTSAAVAAVTNRVQIRAGSVVLPLHHPARVAEDWAVVDNISAGRVGISFAAGWQPDDFVLRPDSFAEAKAVMLRDIDVVRRLWRGERVTFDGPLGAPVEIGTLPRPVQAELPFWLTAAGNVETFVAAGRMGANLLTHLLGQTVEELAEKILAYRRARREAGHVGTGQVSLMLHSFVGPDSAWVRETVRAPLITYLRSSASLIKQYAWSFPAFKRRPGMEQASDVDLAGLSEDELAALLDHAFERYYCDAGLFGTPAECRAMVERVQRAGVDEIACLIDFGIAPDVVLEHLPWLDRVRQNAAERADRSEESLAELIHRHDVTHLQCTPSLARMMCESGAAAASFGRLRHLMIGGEAFPSTLAGDLQATTAAKINNMYGPTETTIWSTTDRVVPGAEAALRIGRPLANQEIYILDRRGELVPPGVPGEIVVAGRGVARGYLHRPELTAERFIAHPLHRGERAYRTGDLGRFEPDGRIAYLGRLDLQVKVRGHRIELGEVEAVLAEQAGVEQAIAVAREDVAGDVRLCAYVVARSGQTIDLVVLRATLGARLPDFMVPSQIVTLTAFPQTPNGKIDRKALPPPGSDDSEPAAATELFVAPSAGIEARLAALWCDVLKLSRVGVTDNFFDRGGHSLLAVQLHRRLRDEFSQSLSITDIFRFPTIASLCAHLDGNASTDAETDRAQHRALKRLATLNRRREAAGRMLINGEG